MGVIYGTEILVNKNLKFKTLCFAKCYLLTLQKYKMYFAFFYVLLKN